jgi:hypothetical protein
VAELSKEQPKIWKNARAEDVALECIEIMLEPPNKLQWRNDYLCLESSKSDIIPGHILQQAFLKLNIVDDQALKAGMLLYRFGAKTEGGAYRAPNLVLAPQTQQNNVQVVKCQIPKPVVHKLQSTHESLQSVLRCLSHIQINKQQLPTSSEALSPWHQVLSQIQTERFEEIPEELLKPLEDILAPANHDGISPILNSFEHVVHCLGKESLFLSSKSSTCKRKVVIKLRDSDLTSGKFEEAISKQVCGEKGEYTTAKFLAVSILCSNWEIDTDKLQIDASMLKSTQYKLSVCIVCDQRKYTSYSRAPTEANYEVKPNRSNARKMWKTVKKEIVKSHAFLIFVQDSSPSEDRIHEGNHSVCQLPKYSDANEPDLKNQSQRKAHLSRGSPESASAASMPATKDQMKLRAEVLHRIQLSSTYNAGEIEQVKIGTCAINLPYDVEKDIYVVNFRRTQMEDVSHAQHMRPSGKIISTQLIERSVAINTNPQHRRYHEFAGWVFVDELCMELRTRTGFTHSLQSLDLELENIEREFKSDTLPFENRYFQYMVTRGMALMEAVTHHNTLCNKSPKQQIKTLLVFEASYSIQLRDKRQATMSAKVFKQTACAHLLLGILPDINESQVTIQLPVSAEDHQSILQIFSNL